MRASTYVQYENAGYYIECASKNVVKECILNRVTVTVMSVISELLPPKCLSEFLFPDNVTR